MFSIVSRLWAVLLVFLFFSDAAYAAEGEEIWDTGITRVWLDEHVAGASRVPRPRASFRLSRTEIWANGLGRSDMQAFIPWDSGRAVGARLQPFQDFDLTLGTELVRAGDDSRMLSSKALWQASWSRDWQGVDGARFGLATAGSVGSLQAGYVQSLSGTVDIPLDLPLRVWDTQLKFSPSMSLDALNGSVSTGLLSEIMGRTVLSSPKDELLSVLNVSVGYGVAADARPVASAKLELRISPNL
jgi:hypothetical protein